MADLSVEMLAEELVCICQAGKGGHTGWGLWCELVLCHSVSYEKLLFILPPTLQTTSTAWHRGFSFSSCMAKGEQGESPV